MFFYCLYDLFVELDCPRYKYLATTGGDDLPRMEMLESISLSSIPTTAIQTTVSLAMQR